MFPADRPVGVKVSATGWVEGGWDLAQTIELGKGLEERGADRVAASSGGVLPAQKIPFGPGYQVPFAQTVKRAADVTAVAVGLITEARQADRALTNPSLPRLV